MKKLASVAVIAVAFGLVSTANVAQAQYKAKSRPFDTSSRRPAVSPYMNLLNNNTGVATNYQSLVRPQIDQQNYNSQSASAIKNLQKQVSSVQRSKSGSEGNQKLRPTGHAATRQNYSHFYPQLNGK